jgi:poly(A) polymerase
MTEREFATEVVRTLRRAGFTAYWAGGCVRDELLGLTPDDYDVATDARPDQIRPLFRRTIEVGAAFGVVEVIGPRGEDYRPVKAQVATFRSDLAYVDGRRPEGVVFSSPEEDAKRRDFTINGMFFDPLEGQLIDHVGGRADLEAKVLRAIGDPHERFREDKLRLLRAVRMATRFGLTVEPVTAAAVREMAGELASSGVSAERIAEEIRKLLVHPRRADGLRLMDDLGLVGAVLPEVETEMKGLPQGPPSAPTGDLWDHVLKVMDQLQGPTWPEPRPVSFPLAFAALLHDVGKRRTQGSTPNKWTFHRHERVGKDMASKICLRLKLSNAERERIEWLVERHQYLCDAPTMRMSKLKPILAHPGIGELLALHRADSVASGRSVAHVEFCERLLRETPPGELDPSPLATGDDLIEMGIPKGPLFKQILDLVREAQLDGTIQTKEEAIEMIRRLLREWGLDQGSA